MRHVVPLLVLLATPAAAAEPPAISQTVTPTRIEAEHDLGLELLWLPVESRASLTDYAGRNLPGAQLDDQGRLLLSGGRPGDVLLEIDGFRFRRLTLPSGLVDRLDVSNAGYGAAYGDAPGGVVGVATKSASDRLHVDAEAYDDNGFVDTTGAAASLAGPIVPGRLYALVAARGEWIRTPDLQDPEGIINPSVGARGHALDAGAKLIWIPRAGQQIESLTLFDDARLDDGAPLGTDAEAQPSRKSRDLATGLRWLGRFGQRITASSQVGYQGHRAEELPWLCRFEPNCEFLPAVFETAPRPRLRFNWPVHEIDHEARWQMLNALSVGVLDRPAVAARLWLSSRLDAEELRWSTHTNGDLFYVRENGMPRSLIESFGVDGASTSSLRTMHALESDVRVGRLWIVPGLGLATAHAHTSAFDFDAAALTPHLTVSWDARGDGRTWLYAGSHQRVSTDVDEAIRVGRQTPVEKTCDWNTTTMAYDRNCIVAGGSRVNTTGLPCGPTGVRADGTPCAGGARLARGWEHGLGASHQLEAGYRFSVDVVCRRSIVRPRVSETNRIWSGAGSTMGGFQNGRAELVWDYSGLGDGSERYLGVTVAARKQAGPVKLLLSYTYSRHENGVFVDPATGFSVATIGPAPDDRPHLLRALVSWDIYGVGSLGLLFSRDRGVPARRLLANTVSSMYEDLNPAGRNPGANVNDPADDGGSVARLPDTTRLNLQSRLRLRLLVGIEADLYADVINLLHSDDLQPRYGRLGLIVRY